MVQTANSNERSSTRKDDVSQLQALAEMKATLDQRTFFLDAGQHEQFLALLDVPRAPSAALETLMKRKPIWDR